MLSPCPSWWIASHRLYKRKPKYIYLYYIYLQVTRLQLNRDHWGYHQYAMVVCIVDNWMPYFWVKEEKRYKLGKRCIPYSPQHVCLLHYKVPSLSLSLSQEINLPNYKNRHLSWKLRLSPTFSFLFLCMFDKIVFSHPIWNDEWVGNTCIIWKNAI